MPRQVDINVGIRTHKAVASINKLIQYFDDLNKSIQKNFPDGTIKLKMDLSGMDTKLFADISKSFKMMGTGIEKVNKNIEDIVKHNKMLNINLSTTRNEINSVTHNYNQYGEEIEKADKKQKSMLQSLMANVAYFEVVRRGLLLLSKSYAELTNATFNVGVAGQMNLTEIQNLNESFLSLSRNVPQSASGLAQAVDDLIRTGRSYEDARKIIEEVAVLATASGDSLKDTAGVVTKVMVSLGISGDRVTDTLNTMHSTAIQTASDMGYLAEAFKNVAGTVSVYTKGTGLAGEALDDYKQKVLDVSMASIGSLANLGLSASQAGTKVKNLFSRLTASEKVARSMFDSAMALNNVTIEGRIFDYDALSNMAQKDLPKALEVMSKLYIEGKLSSQVLQKMFTARHFQEISNILLEINGNVDNFVNSFAKGIDYSNDFKKNMFNINEQFKQFKNNVFAISSKGFQDIQDSMTGAMMIFNDTMRDGNGEVNKMVAGFGGILTKMATIGITSATLVTTLGIFKKTIYPLTQVVGGGLAKSVPLLTGIIFALEMITKQYYDQKKAITNIGIEMNKIPREMNKTQRSLDMLTVKYNKFKDIVTEAGNIDLSKELEKTSTLMDLLLKQSKEFYDVLDVQEKWKIIDVENELDSIAEIYDSYKAQAEMSINEVNLLYARQMEKIASETYYKLMDYGQTTGGQVLGLSFKDEDIEDILYKYKEIAELTPDMEKAREEIIKWISSEYDVHKGLAKRVITYLGEDKNMEFIKEWNNAREEVDKQIKEYNDNFINETNRIMKQSQDIILSFNKSMGYLNQELLKGFGKTGFIQIGETIVDTVTGVETEIYNTYKGFDAVYKIMEKSSIDTTNGLFNQYNRMLSDAQRRLDIFEKEFSNRELTQEETTLQKELNKAVDEYKDKIESLSNSKFYLSKQEFSDLFKDIDYNEKTAKGVLEVAKAQEMLNKIESEEPYNAEKIEFWTRLLEIKRNDLKMTDESIKQEKNRTKYQLKKINFQKESLALELEENKLGKTKTQQAILEYEYRLKTLQVSQEIAEIQLKTVKDKIYDPDFVPTSDKGKELFNIIDINKNDYKSMEEALNNFRAKYMGKLSGDEGSEVNALFKLASEYAKALFDRTKAIKEQKFTNAKELREELERISNLTSDTYKNLYTASSMNIIPRNNYFEKYIEYVKKQFSEEKDKVYADYGLKIGSNIVDNLQESIDKADFLLSLEGNLDKMKAEASKIKELFGIDISKKQDTLETKTLITKLYMTEIGKQEELNGLLEKEIKLIKTKYEETEKILSLYDSMSNIFSKLGDATGVGGLSKLGDAFSAFGEMEKFMKNPENQFSFKNIDWTDFNVDLADNIGKALETSLKGFGSGSAIGSFIGNIVGGGIYSQTLGGLAGIGTSLAGIGGWQGMAIQAGASLIGGLFGNDSADDQAEAEARTKESNKIYNKNTEALQKLAQNMSNLNGGVDGLNNTLISSFSKIPTVGNLNRVTDAMTSMYKTMEKTRIFDNVAYQVTKTKKSKGFLGIGGGSTSWTETIEVSVEEMLNKYGFKGAIEDMTSQQLRDFSKWLDDFDMGDSDNFSILADAIENYAEALDKMEKNIENFFYDTTMESFEGISSLQQEELRQQIEDFYKNLGLQIDDSMLEQIDKLAEEMSVMVTIMQDVRGDFIKSWRDSGVDAGKAFVGSMRPYIDAILTNISQIYYDVYFSDINKELETQFKGLSEKLVELKKQGEKLSWKDVSKELSNNFENIINTINSAKNETESFNTILLELQKQALDSGLSLSEIFELGLVTGTQNTVIETFKDSLMSSEADSAFTSIGNMVGDTIGKALVDKMIDNLLSDKVLEFSAQLDKIVSGNMNFDQLAGLAMEAQSIGMMMESERLRLEAIKDMFSMGEITYQNQEDNIEYSSGVSQSVINNYYLSTSVEASNVIESDSIERLADELLDIILEKLKVDKGIVLK